MAERNANLLVSDAASPQAGIQYADAKPWYGGDLGATLSGTLEGVSVDIVFCTRLPKLDEGQTYADVLTDADWVKLATLDDDNGAYHGPLNPCLLAAKVNTPGAGTRARVIIS